MPIISPPPRGSEIEPPTVSKANQRQLGGSERAELSDDRASGQEDGSSALGLLYPTYQAADFENEVKKLWQPQFPSADLVDLAVGFFQSLPAWNGHEGPRSRVIIGPGLIRISAKDLARAERTIERGKLRHIKKIDADLKRESELDEGLSEKDEVLGSKTEITEWSAKSRAAMVRRMCELDYLPMFTDSSRLPAMVTLTLPGDWETVAPDGQSFKRFLKSLRKRWIRAWGEQPLAVWKLEFQRRGAPHVHLLMSPPPGKDAIRGLRFGPWISQTWAEIVDHPNPDERRKHVLAGTGIDYADGLRASDPKRVAVYFTKHSSANFGDKEYQHVVPELWSQPGAGPGRFWGVWGLASRTSTVEIEANEADYAAKIMRRWARAQGTTRQETVWRTSINLKTGEVKYRKRRVRRRVKRMRGRLGFLSVNDGPAFAFQLSRALDIRRGDKGL